MILKLETYVEVQTSEPTVTKQFLTERLNDALREVVNHNQMKGLLMFVNQADVCNNPKLKKELINTECFAVNLTEKLKGRILTPDQVIERMRS